MAFLVMSETGMFSVAAFIIGLFGAGPLAAAAISNQIAAMVFMIRYLLRKPVLLKSVELQEQICRIRLTSMAMGGSFWAV